MPETEVLTTSGSRLGRLPWRPLICGIAVGLGHVPFGLVPVSLAGLATASILCLRASGVRRAAVLGFWAGVGYFATTLHWIVEPFLIDAAVFGWMSPFALILSAGGFALFWAMAFAAARAVGRGWQGAVAFAAALGIAEMARSYVLTGFPWALVGYVWTEGPGAQLAALIGSFGLTFLTILLPALAAQVVVRHTALGVLALACAWAFPPGAGWLLRPAAMAVAPDAPVIRLVQPNAPQDQKWDPDHALTFVQRQIDYTAADGTPDLVIWSETAIPYFLQEGHPALLQFAAAAGGTPVILGIQRAEGLRAYNSLIELDAEGAIGQVYDKHHLVPFGEFIPLGGLTRWIGLPSFAASDGFGFSPGPGARLIDLERLGQVLPLICYEAIFPQDVAAAPARPDWILQITNDAWFGTFSGPYQHLAQARMRAIEQGLPLIRVANTGVSAVIDSEGRVRESLPLGAAGYLDAALPPGRPPTIYARLGDLPVLAILALCLAVPGAMRFRTRD